MALSTEKIGQIEDRAQGVLRDVFHEKVFQSPPVGLSEIAKFYGIDLSTANFENPDVIGAYSRENRKIYVSAGDPNTRQRFTIAHELGHFILHDDYPEETFYRDQYAHLLTHSKHSIEQEANWFAASLLMPAEATNLYWRDIRDISDFATMFRVSISAATYRLKNLGLIE